mgnify:CR=1 FL=1
MMLAKWQPFLFKWDIFMYNTWITMNWLKVEYCRCWPVFWRKLATIKCMAAPVIEKWESIFFARMIGSSSGFNIIHDDVSWSIVLLAIVFVWQIFFSISFKIWKETFSNRLKSCMSGNTFCKQFDDGMGYTVRESFCFPDSKHFDFHCCHCVCVRVICPCN